MIQLLPDQLPALSRWFPAAAPGPATLAEHALATGTGQWWADRAVHPRTVAIRCADHALLRGDPDALTTGDLTPLADCYIDAPDRFLPALATTFDQVTPWERMVYVQRTTPSSTPRLPWGVTVRRLAPEHAPALAELGTDAAWIHGTWGGPTALAASGLGWAAFHKDRVLAIACAYFLSSTYEDIACVTVPEHRRERLAVACVTALCTDIAARGHTPSWSCSSDNRPSRLLAWTAGFRLEREYVHYAAGSPAQHDHLTA
ncbi:GNAT family N-acetyltransferase [Streptomyces sp. NBC_01340]|uniref:GNAT family N-acetyltransferase n=1 Tax=unclassified Streptomyces TaxID=2593676 RepID=UPI0022585AE2|nr:MULTISPECIES: GNAT family N-acetyltransferase [unclassified Streptomyces]MCX4457983.1 GNAT family N-acetyltransferase [Streptomyces sp. NBC_01719]MCX4497340.1 GNAT family N-acetyltransferase [Streptomyces sp. NBC_01728]MCX4596615.1 GNAT family N-acetyltransferase [Streptomyces sp. NBC_01549]WSI42189.1 GNAT family N-acetyltransferase [Streptomyces sp. NBC_01340]